MSEDTMDRDEEFFDVEESEEDTDEVMQMTQESNACMSPPELPPSEGISGGTDVLEKCGRWLQSIPRDDIIELRQTDEYQDFIRAFERLGQRHRQVISTRIGLDTASLQGGQQRGDYSFLQHLAVDDVLLKVFEFLECTFLVRTSMTCSRFRELANRSGTQRTHDVANARQLNNVMQLLRAKEQIDGIGTTIRHCHVPVPMLGLRKRVLVTNAGDPEYNGIYFCTGSNGNGFVFTKARFSGDHEGSPTTSTSRSSGSAPASLPQQAAPPVAPQAEVNAAAVGPPTVVAAQVAVSPSAASSSSGDGTNRRQLRCIIAKRFSNETILWYMSKEVQPATDESRISGTRVGEVPQVFSFWAKLLVIGEASPDDCRYPSPTSILSRGGGPAWQSLSSTRTTDPPTVELLD